MRHGSERRKKLEYDYRWLQETGWMLPALCLSHIMAYNRRRVYGSHID
jgi:hypothetical protein